MSDRLLLSEEREILKDFQIELSEHLSNVGVLASEVRLIVQNSCAHGLNRETLSQLMTIEKIINYFSSLKPTETVLYTFLLSLLSPLKSNNLATNAPIEFNLNNRNTIYRCYVPEDSSHCGINQLQQCLNFEQSARLKSEPQTTDNDIIVDSGSTKSDSKRTCMSNSSSLYSLSSHGSEYGSNTQIDLLKQVGIDESNTTASKSQALVTGIVPFSVAQDEPTNPCSSLCHQQCLEHMQIPQIKFNSYSKIKPF